MGNFEKTTFLFGSGAEGCFGLPLGANFTYECLIKENKPLADTIKELCNTKDRNENYKDWLGEIQSNSSTRLMFQNIVQRTVAYYIKRFEFLDDMENIDDKQFKLIWYSADNSKKDSYKKRYKGNSIILKKFEDIEEFEEPQEHPQKVYFDKLYQNYNNLMDRESTVNSLLPEFCFDNKLKGWEKNLISYDSVENYFYTVLNPKKYGPVKFTRLLNYYWKAYFSIVEKLIPDIITDNFYYNYIKKISKNEDSNYINNIIKSKIITANENSYYEHLKAKKPRGILTTNYTSFVESIFDNEKDRKGKISYINGNLNWFEYPYEMKVIDITDDNEKQPDDNHVFFPFIFATSSIKPVIHPKQINEYHKAITLLGASNYLVTIGFGFCEDDNHLITIIKDWLYKDLKHILIVTSYTDKILTDEKMTEKMETEKKNLLVKFHIEESDKVSENQIITIANINNGVKNPEDLYQEIEKLINN
jgi:hypothetical protein